MSGTTYLGVTCRGEVLYLKEGKHTINIPNTAVEHNADSARQNSSIGKPQTGPNWGAWQPVIPLILAVCRAVRYASLLVLCLCALAHFNPLTSAHNRQLAD
jgi:hypothetical protein